LRFVQRCMKLPHGACVEYLHPVHAYIAWIQHGTMPRIHLYISSQRNYPTQHPEHTANVGRTQYPAPGVTYMYMPMVTCCGVYDRNSSATGRHMCHIHMPILEPHCKWHVACGSCPCLLRLRIANAPNDLNTSAE
jgi:hypothetical protein